MNFSKYWKSWVAFLAVLTAITFTIWHFKYSYHEKNVRNVFFDPGSVQVRNRHWSLNGEYFCAEANAKNRFGAYVGFQRVITAFDYVFLERGGLDQLPKSEDILKQQHSSVAIELATAKLEAEKKFSDTGIANNLSQRELDELSEKEGAKNLMNEMWTEHCS